MVDHHQRGASRTEDAAHFLDRAGGIGRVMQNAVRVHDIEGRVGERQVFRIGDANVRVQSLDSEALSRQLHSPRSKIHPRSTRSLPHPIHEIGAGAHAYLEKITPLGTSESRERGDVRLPFVSLPLEIAEEAGAVRLRDVPRATWLSVPVSANALLEVPVVAANTHHCIVELHSQTSSSSIVSGYTGKRLLDLMLTAVTAPVWGVLVAALALLVRLRLGAPAFFVQTRPGLHGTPFRLVKLRTMSAAVDASGALLSDRDRLTALGQFLRSTSLDELPELWNVLRGDMSLVGPRPLLTKYLPLYSERHRRRHDVRPGVTGLAQVSGRNAITWPERLDLDVEYVDRCSFMLDLRILWRSARAVARREGISAEGEATMPEFTGYDRA